MLASIPLGPHVRRVRPHVVEEHLALGEFGATPTLHFCQDDGCSCEAFRICQHRGARSISIHAAPVSTARVYVVLLVGFLVSSGGYALHSSGKETCRRVFCTTRVYT